jgi:hypothetical protein
MTTEGDGESVGRVGKALTAAWLGKAIPLCADSVLDLMIGAFWPHRFFALFIEAWPLAIDHGLELLVKKLSGREGRRLLARQLDNPQEVLGVLVTRGDATLRFWSKSCTCCEGGTGWRSARTRLGERVESGGDEESVRLLCKAMKRACTTRSAAVGLMGPLKQWRPVLMGEVTWSAWSAFEDLRLHAFTLKMRSRRLGVVNEPADAQAVTSSCRRGDMTGRCP